MWRRKYLQHSIAVLWIIHCVHIGTAENVPTPQETPDKNDEEPKKDSRGLFSPRMDYDQWTPLGRGDPLKNDPTYDYVPPVLERVHYWIDPASRKPDPALPSEVKKTEILVLGVSSKKPSNAAATPQLESRKDNCDPFLKFVDAPKFNYHGIYSRPKQNYGIPTSFYSSPYFPSKPKYESVGAYVVKDDQRTPYTMLMPPPLHQPVPEPSPYKENVTSVLPYDPPTTSATTVSIAAANLIYQSSSASNGDEWRDSVASNTQFATLAESSSQVTWRTPTPDATDDVASHNNSQSVSIQVGHTPIQMSGESAANSSPSSPLAPVHGVQMLHVAGDQPTVAHVTVGGMPMMYKGQVTDDTIDLDSAYVNIGKPQVHSDPARRPPANAHMFTVLQHTSPPTNKYFSYKPVKSASVLRPNYVLHPSQLNYMPMPVAYRKPTPPPSAHITSHLPSYPPTTPPIKAPPMTLQTMQTMQTMQPPTITDDKRNKPDYPTPLLQSILQKETHKVTVQLLPTTTTKIPPTTTTSSLTTDPLFSHYKQPAAPLRGPMYLIIQGHSKVKTYGANKPSIHGIPVQQETNEISHIDDAQNEYRIKHLHSNHLKEVEEPVDIHPRVSKDLQTLQHVLDTGLGAFDVSTTVGTRQKREFEVREAVLGAQYEVGTAEHTTELYRKGIVETGEISHVPRKKGTARVKRQLSVFDG